MGLLRGTHLTGLREVPDRRIASASLLADAARRARLECRTGLTGGQCGTCTIRPLV